MLNKLLPLCLALVAAAVHASPEQDPLAALLASRGLLPVSTPVSGPSVSRDQASKLLMTALGFSGSAYRMGGTSVETGFDCSGFVQHMYRDAVGLKLPRDTASQAAATQPIDAAHLAPGDLVFFNTQRRAHSHVGIYVGDGKFIHAPRTGEKVRLESMNARYWQKRFDGARRVLSGLKPPAPSAIAAPLMPPPSSPTEAAESAIAAAERAGLLPRRPR